MFTEKDLSQMASQGISQAEVEQQIQHFRQGFPFMHLSKAATVADGILRLDDTTLANATAYFDEASASLELLKFVPASGAATRMFKSLFGFLEAGKKDKSVEQFFEQLSQFAFAQELQNALPANASESTIVEYFLTEKGLDYGALPKGLLTFHRYESSTRTSVEEHLVEGATYASASGHVRLHFTVSPEHRPKFKALINKVLPVYENEYGVKFDIAFSEQKPATDTIAVNLDNTPFREKDGSLLFRPAGHGALLSNLNDIEADVVFIKNIDNVVPDAIKPTTIQYKKALAGVLLQYQQRIFSYQSQLHSGNVLGTLLSELATFFAAEMCVLPPADFGGYSDEQKIAYFSAKLNRPLRICGMVPNVGEPGGGPFWCMNSDGTTSLQVVESAQVDMDNAEQKTVFMNATHFNPVDLICSLKDYQGKKFDIMAFRDPQTGFITQKSKDGKDLKAQELPGLWNGSMANWNTLFVEVPLITFNPVKTVNDLLRAEHQ